MELTPMIVGLGELADRIFKCSECKRIEVKYPKQLLGGGGI